jgi:hypothetical protein
MNKALAQALQRAPAPATPWYNQQWAQPVPQYNAAWIKRRMAKRLDPSLTRALAMTESELKRLESAAKTFNSLVGKMQANMPREATEVVSVLIPFA